MSTRFEGSCTALLHECHDHEAIHRLTVKSDRGSSRSESSRTSALVKLHVLLEWRKCICSSKATRSAGLFCFVGHRASNNRWGAGACLWSQVEGRPPRIPPTALAGMPEGPGTRSTSPRLQPESQPTRAALRKEKQDVGTFYRQKRTPPTTRFSL